MRKRNIISQSMYHSFNFIIFNIFYSIRKIFRRYLKMICKNIYTWYFYITMKCGKCNRRINKKSNFKYARVADSPTPFPVCETCAEIIHTKNQCLLMIFLLFFILSVITWWYFETTKLLPYFLLFFGIVITYVECE